MPVEERRVQQIQDSFYVNIASDLRHALGLEKGDFVTEDVEDGKLIIEPKQNGNNKHE